MGTVGLSGFSLPPFVGRVLVCSGVEAVGVGEGRVVDSVEVMSLAGDASAGLLTGVAEGCVGVVRTGVEGVAVV